MAVKRGGSYIFPQHMDLHFTSQYAY